MPQVGDTYGGGIVAIADSVSGELVIVPDAEALGTIRGNTYNWAAAKSFAESYSDGVNSDYRLITKAEALAILTNNDLLSQLGLTGTENFWTIEEIDLERAYVFSLISKSPSIRDKDASHLAFPIRKVNFYGLPLIESEFGGGLVYDVVAATREVKVIPKWSDVIHNSIYDWDTAIHNYPSSIGEVYFMALPTRAEALKIFGNSYLVTLAGLPVDNDYWTSEDVGNGGAWYFNPNTLIASVTSVSSQFYALPVRSETV